MTFAEFIDKHIDHGGLTKAEPGGYTILHAIELARRHPEAETRDALAAVARRELRAISLPADVSEMLVRLFALYRIALKTDQYIFPVKPKPVRRRIL